MTPAEKKMKKYVNAIEQRLNMPISVKSRVMADVTTTIILLRENGKTDEEIYAELGTPRKVAAELNTQMKDFAYQKSPWRFLFLALGILAGLTLLYNGILQLVAWWIITFASGGASIGIIGGADGPTSIFVTTAVSTDPAIWPWVMLLLLIVGFTGYRTLCRRPPKAK